MSVRLGEKLIFDRYHVILNKAYFEGFNPRIIDMRE
jgi:hypothetical protein